MIKNDSQSMLPSGDVKFNASDLEACRICLATDVKLYSLQDTRLGICMESIGGFANPCVDLPNYVCYECSPILFKCNKLIEKSKTAQATLLDIFDKNGEVAKTLIKDQDRSQLNLQSSLDSYSLFNYYDIEFDDGTNTAEFIETKSVPSKNNIETGDEKPDVEMEKDKAEEGNADDNTKEDFISLTPYKMQIAFDNVLQKDQYPRGISQQFQYEPKNLDMEKRGLKRKLSDIYPTEEFKYNRNSNLSLVMELNDIRQYFNIVNIPIPEQVTKWRQNLVKYIGSGFICSVCHMSFANAESRQAHSYYHNPRIHGNVTCEVCLLCFPTIQAKQYHSERVHANKFCCKFCPMVFNEIDDAKAHKNSPCARAMGLFGIRNAHIPGPRPLPAVPFIQQTPVRNRSWYQRHW